MEALELLNQCFPTGREGGSRYVALAGKRGLRWILPVRSKRLDNVLAAWRPYSIPARAGWQLLRLVAKGGGLSYLPSTETFSLGLSATDWRDYGWDRQEPPMVLAYVGTPGAHRKLVVTLVDSNNGSGCLVVKCPLVATAWKKIEREYYVLKELQNEGSMVAAPQPVHIDYEKRFTVQTYLEGRPTDVRLTSAHYQFLASLYRYGSIISLEDVRAQTIMRRDRLVERSEIPSDNLARLERLLNKNIWSGKVPGVRIHGDFAPWNLKWCGESSICAVDWEDAQPLGLPFYDLHFYQMQVERLLGKGVKVDWAYYARMLVDMVYPEKSLKKLQPGCEAQAMVTILEQTYAC